MQNTPWLSEARSGGTQILMLAALLRELSLCRGLADVIRSVTPAARGLLGADGVSFVLREGDLCHYAEEDAIEPLWKGQRFPIRASISGWAMLDGQTVVVPDIAADPRVPAEAYRATFVRSLAMAPVRPQAPLAVLGAYWRTNRQPDTWAVELLQAVADATALAISHVQLTSPDEWLPQDAEAVAQASEGHRRMLVDAAPDHAVYLLDLEGRVTSWNAGAERILGYRHDEIIGQSFARFFTPEERLAGVPAQALRLAAETGRWDGEGWRLRKDGTRCRADSVVDAIHDETGALVGFVTISGGITARRRAHQAMLATTEQLEQRVAERTRDLNAARLLAEQANQAKSRFLAAASHDLRQPFQAIALYYDLLSARLSDPYDRKVLDGLGLGVAAGQQLLAALLDVSALDAGIPEPSPLPFVLDDVIEPVFLELSAVAAEKGLELRGVPCRRTVTSDPVLIGRVVRNLVSNAIKYTSSGGVLVGCRRAGAAMRIEVWDTGCGIPADKLEAIFDDFFQVANPERDRRKGLGLGLAIVARSCRLLGCRYGVRSTEGRGSVFWIEVE